MNLLLRTVLLLGCLQGAISCILLFRSKRHRQANRLLGVLILLTSLATLKVYGDAEGWWDGGLVPILIANFLPFFLIMPIGPLVYFYTRSYLDSRFVFGKRDRVHFHTVWLDLVPVLVAWLYVILGAFGLTPHGPQAWGQFIDEYNVYVDIPRWISVTVYLVFSWRAFKVADTGVSAESLRWLKQFLGGFLVFQAVWLLYLIPYIPTASGDWMLDHLGWYPLYIPLTILSYWLGIKGYLLSQVLPVSGTLLPDTTVTRTIRTLLRSMEEDKVYRNPDLNLSMLATHTGTAPKTLSAVLNQHLHKSFNEFINEYRVREVQGRLLDGGARERTIAGLAYECGFNSLPTFQRAFKSVSGVSPKEFLLKSGIE
jgi:AraC-like DNA-binding protein